MAVLVQKNGEQKLMGEIQFKRLKGQKKLNGWVPVSGAPAPNLNQKSLPGEVMDFRPKSRAEIEAEMRIKIKAEMEAEAKAKAEMEANGKGVQGSQLPGLTEQGTQKQQKEADKATNDALAKAKAKEKEKSGK